MKPLKLSLIPMNLPNSRSFLAIFALSFALDFSAAKLSAVSIVDFANPGIVLNNGAFTLGFTFQVNSTISVDGLGFFDDGKNGLTQSHNVGLWTGTGTLLASAMVTNANALDSWFRYATISTLTLAPGTYVVAATSGSENYAYEPIGFFTAPQITFVRDSFVFGPTLAFPTQTDVNATIGFFGGNVRLANVGAMVVPEAGSAAWLLLVGLGGLALARRRLV